MKTKNFIFSVIILLVATLNLSAQTVKQMNSVEIQQVLQKNKKIIILDVRTPGEFAAGHLKNAINIDIYQQDFYSNIDKLDKTKTYMVYCRTNRRSGVTSQYMKEKGFSIVYQMMDGFPGWAANNLPYEK